MVCLNVDAKQAQSCGATGVVMMKPMIEHEGAGMGCSSRLQCVKETVVGIEVVLWRT